MIIENISMMITSLKTFSLEKKSFPDSNDYLLYLNSFWENKESSEDQKQSIDKASQHFRSHIPKKEQVQWIILLNIQKNVHASDCKLHCMTFKCPQVFTFIE